MRRYRIDNADDQAPDENESGVERPDRRPILEALLTAACCLALAANVQIFRAYKTTPMALAAGVWKYGPLGLFDDPPIPPFRLSDPSNFHTTCGPDCPARNAKGGAL